jgi:AcrR family transcriptional regulator
VAPIQTEESGRRPAGAGPDLLVAAFTKAVAEQGYRAVTLDSVARAAGIPRARVEARFASAEDGLAAAQEAFLERLWLEVVDACAAPAGWPRKVAAGLACALGALGEAGGPARAFTVEATGSSLAAAERQLALTRRFAGLLAGGRRLYPRAAAMPPLGEEVLVGGVAAMAADLLRAEEPAALLARRPELTEMLLIPYLGAREAHAVAHG